MDCAARMVTWLAKEFPAGNETEKETPLQGEPMDTNPPPRHVIHDSQPLYDPYTLQTHYGIHDQQGSLFDAGWISPKRLLRVVRKKWLTILLVLVFAIVAAAFYLHKAESIYKAHAQIELSVRRPRILTQQAAVIEDPGGSGSSEEIFNTRMERFRSRAVMQIALDNLLREHPEALRPPPRNGDAMEIPPAQDREARLRAFMARTQLSLLRRTRIVQITFEHPDPMIAAAACNAFTKAAETSSFDENRSNSDAAVVWLETQEEAQRNALQQTEAQLLQFLATSGIDALESRRKTVEESLLAFNRSLVEIQSEESRVRDLRHTLENLDLHPELAGNLPTSIPRSDEIRTVLGQWREAVVGREQLLARFTTNHPDVRAQERLIDLYREQASTAIAQAKAATAANEKLLTQQANSLRQHKEEQAALAQELDIKIAEARTRIAALERARDAAEQSYRGILARIQDARLAADENTATVKIVEPAIVPNRPVRPRPPIVLALAVLLGFGTGMGFALVVEHLEDHVVDPDDLNAWGLPMLAVVPRVKTKDRATVATASLRDRFSQVTEAFAGLRAMLDSPQHREQAQIVLVTSSMPGEGKTVTSCNLAAAWAQKKRRVLLIDFDLRRPRLAGIFPMPAGQLGLLSALSSGTPIEHGNELAYPCEGCPTLDIIATRPVSGASPAELAGTPSVERLLLWARKHYDHIVIDAPPLGLVSDALALAPLADKVLVMVRPSVSRKRVSLHSIKRFQDSGIQNIALVVNDVDFSTFGYGAYGPYYHYHKHYKIYAGDSTTGKDGD